ncbi:MAG: hypothetical protein K0Q81_1501 [Paenibacillus sp.]|nr:hypothetical protein [Paenibacillus sp.]
MRWNGRVWTRRELEARVGRLEQIGGIRRLQLLEGTEAGNEQIQIRTGAGLAYYISASRGLDISLAEFRGVPISWQSPNGDVHPAYFNASGAEWLRTAAGGLLMTCGLSQAGAPNVDQGYAFGLHGRVHHTPARHVSVNGAWDGDEYVMTVSGVVEETFIFGEQLRLVREISSRLGENRLTIRDTVENPGFKACPHMMLYHFNFGFPLMNESTRIHMPTARIAGREAHTPVEGYDRWTSPDPTYSERVYYHEVRSDEAGRATAVIESPDFPGSETGVQARLSWSTEHLPRLVQWHMPGAGTHVLGIEPANCHVGGRAEERANGSLVMLEAGCSVTYELDLEINLLGA